MRIVFLGVGGGVPSLGRALPAVAVRLDGRLLLWDCGEGTQMQLQKAGLSLQRITEIYISHLHGDHVLGLPGLISSMTLLRRSKPLLIFGPEAVKALVDATLELTQVKPEFELEIREVKTGTVFRHPNYSMEALPAIHSVPSLSFVLRITDAPGHFDPSKANRLGVPQGPLWKQLQQGQSVKIPGGRTVTPAEVLGPRQKGAVIAYSGDTAPNPEFAKAAHGASLMIHDATFAQIHATKAAEYLHSTATQAAEIAKQAEAKQLALVHISLRYQSIQQHKEEAQAVLDCSIAPSDLDSLEIRSRIPTRTLKDTSKDRIGTAD
jgi:ribonuclease Z